MAGTCTRVSLCDTATLLAAEPGRFLAWKAVRRASCPGGGVSVGAGVEDMLCRHPSGGRAPGAACGIKEAHKMVFVYRDATA